MIKEACSTSSTEEGLGCRIMSELDGLPANLPISFFSLIHDLGFVADERDELKSSIRRLAREGRILMSNADDGIELSTPLQSSRLTVGSSTMIDAVAVFGKPLSETSGDATTILTYRLRPHHPGRRRFIAHDQTFVGFNLRFGPSGVLVRIENVHDRAGVTTT